MYESFFGLSSRPFPAAPLVQHYFPAAATEQARQTLIRIVDRAEGPGLIIGQPGLGKTLLLRMLDHHFQNIFHCIHLASAAIESRKDLLQNVLFELDLPYRDMEEGELRLSLLDFLRPSEDCPHGVLLLVDEAHTLPLQLLDEIRMITNLVRDGQPRMRLVLAGDTQLDEIFADPRLDSFNQRIAARVYLEPLNQDETSQYIQAQIAAIGGRPGELFKEDALVAVYRASGGIPRIINQVCDHSLVMASLGGYHQLDAAGIEEAWADLQQLPGPWSDSPTPAATAGESIIEFGALDEDTPATASSAMRDHDHSVASDSTSEPFEATAPREEPPAAVHSEPAAQSSEDGDPWTPEQDDAINGEAEVADTVENEQTDPEPPAIDPADYYATNVVQVDWELQAIDTLAVEKAEAAMEQDPVAGIASPSEVMAGDVAAEPQETADDSDRDQCAELAGRVAQPQADTEPRGIVASGFDDPFGQGFVDEEVVVDRYAPQERGVFAGCPRVSSEEGRVLAAIIDQQAGPQPAALDIAEAISAAQQNPGGKALQTVDSLNQPPTDAAPAVLAATGNSAATDPPHADAAETDAQETDAAEAGVADETPSRPSLTTGTADKSDKAGQTGEAAASDSDLASLALASSVFDTSSLSDWLFESSTESVTVDVREESTDAPQPAAAREASPHAEPEAPAAEGAQDIAKSTKPVAEPVGAAPEGATAEAEDEPEPAFLQVHDGSMFNDDRDLIVIDDDKDEGVFLTQSGEDLARRIEYQQLFSQLREG